MSSPDFLIIGAMKGGTSTLAAQLSAQAGIFMTTPKEPNYFSNDAIFAKGAGWYAGLFADAAPGDLKGEASTHYTKLPTYPETVARARAALDAPKIVYIIRNPVDRAVSHFIHEWSQGVMSGDVEAAFDTHTELVDYGRYAMQIKPWIEAFGSDAVRLVCLETLKANPGAILSEVAAFIGHPTSVAWDEDHARENVSAERMRKFPLHGLLIDNPVAQVLRRVLVPKGIREAIRHSRQINDRPDLPEALCAKLETIYAEDYAELTALLPNHACLEASYPFLRS